jgi:hypothetical protein
MKQPALIATRILFAVSDDAATDAPTITPMKLVQATASLCEKMLFNDKVFAKRWHHELCFRRTEYIQQKALHPSSSCL